MINSAFNANSSCCTSHHHIKMGNKQFGRHKHKPHSTTPPPPNYSLPPTKPPPEARPPASSHMMGLSLPYVNVDSSLRALAAQAEGFGRLAIGGLHGPLYHVSTLSVSGIIELKSYLNLSSYKTIDGRGQRIKLTGKGLRLKGCEHVIVCNLEIEGGRGSDVDGIQIKPNSKHIWIDRCSLSDFADGLIDITRESTDITISRCRFSSHDKTILIGADPSHTGDRCIRVTIHHCFFDGTRQRHPRVRFAKVHLYNNYTRNWGIYAVCASVESQIYSQCNIYEAGDKKVAFKYLHEQAADKAEANTGCIKSEGDLFVRGTQSGLLLESTGTGTGPNMFHPSEYYQSWTLEPPSDALKHFLQQCTGCRPMVPPVDQSAVTYK